MMFHPMWNSLSVIFVLLSKNLHLHYTLFYLTCKVVTPGRVALPSPELKVRCMTVLPWCDSPIQGLNRKGVCSRPLANDFPRGRLAKHSLVFPYRMPIAEHRHSNSVVKVQSCPLKGLSPLGGSSITFHRVNAHSISQSGSGVKGV